MSVEITGIEQQDVFDIVDNCGKLKINARINAQCSVTVEATTEAASGVLSNLGIEGAVLTPVEEEK